MTSFDSGWISARPDLSKIKKPEKTRPARCHIEKVVFLEHLVFNIKHISVGSLFESALVSTRREQSNEKNRAPLAAIFKKSHFGTFYVRYRTH